MLIPTEADWRDYSLDLDVRCAYESFGCKDLKAACKLFTENSLECGLELRDMPLACFRYCLKAFNSYLYFPLSKNDIMGLKSFVVPWDCE